MNIHTFVVFIAVGIGTTVGLSSASKLGIGEKIPCLMNYSLRINWASSALQTELDDVDETQKQKEMHSAFVGIATDTGEIVTDPSGNEFYVPENCYAEKKGGLVILWRKL